MSATIMATSAAFTAVLLCAAILAAAQAGNDDLVAQTCANATHDFCRLRVTKGYCMSALRSDHRSAAAKEPRDLALVAFDLVKLSAAAADARIGAALGGVAKGDKRAERSLRYCRLDYGTVARMVPECRDMLELYKPGGPKKNAEFYDLYKSHSFHCVRLLIGVSEECKDRIAFRKEEVRKAVGKDIDEVFHRAMLAKAMLEQMLGGEFDWPAN